MKGLLKYLDNYKKESVLAPLLKMAEAGFELFVPLVIASIIDVGIAGGDKVHIYKMGVILLLLAIVGLTVSITAQYFAAKAATGFSYELRHGLFKHIQSLSFTELDEEGTSTLIARMTSDINQVQNGVNMVLRLFLRSPIIVFGAMIMAFTVDWKSAIIFVVTIPLLTFAVVMIMKFTIPLYRKVQNKLDTVLGKTRENLTGVRVIRAFNKEEEEKQQFVKETRELNEIQIFVGKISALMNPVTYIIVNVATIVLIWTGAIRVDTGAISQGEVVALVNYMSQILVELVKLANLIITVTKAIACANRLDMILKVESSMTAPDKTIIVEKDKKSNVAVEFKDVSMSYKNAGAEAISGLTFKASKGDIIGIIGGTGSGKSTVVNLIPRFYDASKGQVLVEGIDVKEYNLEELRSKIGNVMQKAVLFQGTIRSNLLWGNENATEEELIEALKMSQAYEFVSKMDKGLDEEVAQNGRNLSGGQRQRLSIARALVRKPEILILDDSTSALDFATDAKLRLALKELKDTTTFIISQRTSSIMHANQIIVLDDGEVAGIGTHDSLLESCQIYKEIYASQFAGGGKQMNEVHSSMISDDMPPNEMRGQYKSGEGVQ